jgi:thiosulfate dehydrogenase (quinone) large subunit
MTATLREIDLRNTKRRRDYGRSPATGDEPGAETVADTSHTVTDTTPFERVVARHAWAVSRIAIGFVFLWAFFDKLLALGYATGTDRETGAIDRFGDAAWINGGSPTTGFLSGVTGPFKGVFEPLAGAAWADWLFMIGLLAIGTALVLGIGMRIAAATGALLLVFMWMASLPLENNLFVDEHLVYAVVLVGIAAAHAGDTLGAGRMWARTNLVRRHPVLR